MQSKEERYVRMKGIILAGGGSDLMKGLTDIRAVAAMPVAGAYRAVDFALSNMANSKINTVAVLTQYSSRSLNEHLSAPSWWGFGRKQGGLYLLNPTITPESTNWFRGTADALVQNLDFIKERHEPYVVIASGDGVYKLDFDDVMEKHVESGAQIHHRMAREGRRREGTVHQLRHLPDPQAPPDPSARGMQAPRRLRLRARRAGAEPGTGTHQGLRDGRLLEEHRLRAVIFRMQHGHAEPGTEKEILL